MPSLSPIPCSRDIQKTEIFNRKLADTQINPDFFSQLLPLKKIFFICLLNPKFDVLETNIGVHSPLVLTISCSTPYLLPESEKSFFIYYAQKKVFAKKISTKKYFLAVSGAHSDPLIQITPSYVCVIFAKLYSSQRLFRFLHEKASPFQLKTENH